MNKSYGKSLVVALAVFFLAFGPGYASAAPASGNGNGNGNQATTADSAQDEKTLIEAAQAMRRAGLVQLNFTDIELVKFVRFMSELLQKNIVVPPSVTAKVTVISPKPSSIQEAQQIMLSVLQAYGWSLQDMGTYFRLAQGGVSTGADVSRGRGSPGPGEQTVTHIVPLDYITADYVVQTLQQTFGQTVIALPVGNGRDIMLQGRAVDVNKSVQIIRGIDDRRNVKTSRAFILEFGDPATVANQLNAIAQTGGHLRGLTAIPDPSSRKVIVVAEPAIIADAALIIRELDVLPNKAGDFHVYKLQNIDATAAAEQIGKVLAASAMLQPNQDGKYPATVVPDVTTNSLIFASSQRQYDALEKILMEIDVQPKQVLIRGFLAEVNVSNLDKAGIDWSIMGGQMWDNFMLGGMGQLGEGAIPSQFMEWFNELSRSEEMVERNGSTYSVTNYKPLALVYTTIEMLKKYDAVNILSVPRLMCTDNKESSFQVGQVIPVLKGSTSELSNPGAVQQNMDYKDTGLTLTVTPHIRSGNLVALDIEQTTEDVLTATTSVTPVTAKRKVKTSVVVEDGETIILGGMVKETEKSLKRRVPGLSYIPLIGSLFQKVSKEKEKVDFIIFLTPQIIRNTEEMRQVTSQTAMISSDIVERPHMSPLETEVDRRFGELYKKSLKNQK
ncbi:MAG: type II secretion system secretin GspD [Synergistaceae bacterium]|nr:type II secretion system secretin GspD [Synergistaceae bacterium]